MFLSNLEIKIELNCAGAHHAEPVKMWDIDSVCRTGGKDHIVPHKEGHQVTLVSTEG